MRLHITSAIHSILKEKYRHMLLTAPEFKDVQYHENGGFTSFSLMEYQTMHAQFAALVSKKIKDQLGDKLGVFTRKHSLTFLQQVRDIVDAITPEESVTFEERLKTMWD